MHWKATHLLGAALALLLTLSGCPQPAEETSPPPAPSWETEPDAETTAGDDAPLEDEDAASDGDDDSDLGEDE